MLVRLRLLSASYFIPVLITRLVKSTKAPPRWTGWSRSRSGALPLLRLRQPVSGNAITITIALISLILLVTWILPLKLSAACASLMEQLQYLMQSLVCSHNLKQFGVRLINTMSRALHSLIKWIARAQILITPLTRFVRA